MLNWLKRVIDRGAVRSRVHFDDVGVVAESPDAIVSKVRWDDVVRIEVWKRDLFTVDEVVLQLSTLNDDVVISEDDDGYKELVAELGRRFPLAPDCWRSAAFPPFEEAHRVLWSRG